MHYYVHTYALMRASDIAQRCAALQLQSDIKNELDRFQSGHVCAHSVLPGYTVSTS